MTITRRHHPFEGKSLEVLSHTHRQDRLHFLLILPDGSKSLIPAAWTDFDSAARSPQQQRPLVGSLEDLLRTRFLVDALLNRAAGSTEAPATPVTEQESHAPTTAEVQRHPDPGRTRLGTGQRRAKTARRRSPGPPDHPGRPGEPTPGGNQ
ncbi:MAG: hypothetical protein GY953_21755 [bacterium]|nr:hypothetical protein [bacterium]